MLKVKSRQIEEVTVVELSGRIDLDEGSTILRNAVRELAKHGQSLALLNLADVSEIDSSGIGELVGALTTLRDHGGELKLVNLNEKVHDLLRITKLDSVFDVQDNEAAALAAFKNKTAV